MSYQAKEPDVVYIGKRCRDPLLFLRAVAENEEVDIRLRVDCAKALMPYVHGKIGELGKKEQRDNAAKQVASGKFSPSAPPAKLLKIAGQ